MSKKLITIFYFLFSFFFVNAQQTKQRFKVIHADSLSPIPYATLVVLHKSSTAITDLTGISQIDVSIGDTVLIRALGFFPMQVVISNLEMPPVFRALLIPKSFNIKEVTIKGIRTKDELKMAILKMRIEEKQRDIPGIKLYHGSMKKPPAGAMSPISMIYESEWAKKQRAKKWSRNLIMPQIK